MTTTPDTREGLLQQARAIAADWLDVRNPKNISTAAIRRGEADGAAIVQVALAALSTATPPVDGEAKIREALEQLRGEFSIERAIGQRQIEQLEAALQRLLWAATERDRRNRIREFDQIIDEAREALASTQTGGGE